MANAPAKKTKYRVKSYGKPKPISKAEGTVDPRAVRSNALDADDEFTAEVLGFLREKGVKIVGTPYNLSVLASLCQVNNALGPCVDAMEVNIDGTGHVIRLKEDEGNEETPDQEKKREGIEDFFDEVWPSTSFVTMRRKLRRDLETTGMGYLEAIRSIDGTLLFLRHLKAKDMRLVKLDEPVDKEVKVMRGGSEESVFMSIAERRYVQRVGNKAIFFKEFKATRELDKFEGKWEGTVNADADGDADLVVVTPERKASEIIMFTMTPDARTPYAVPRWIGQIPSVLGSRQAEENNLAFFDTGGIPPVLITVAGGTLAEETARAMNNFLAGRPDTKHRGFVIEVEPGGGNTEKDAPVKIEVHRFGAEQVKDSMFENYDQKCEKRVRRSFRLPPLFVGQAEDFSFATAFASYIVAEEQVFKPERHEFDEMINNLIMPELDPEREFEFFSMPISVQDVTTKLEAIKMAKEAGAIDGEGLLDALNELVHLDPPLLLSEEEPEEEDPFAIAPPGQQMQAIAPIPQPGRPPVPQQKGAGSKRKPRGAYKGKRRKRAKAEDLVELARKAHLLMTSKSPDRAKDLIDVSQEVASLGDQDKGSFDSLLSVMEFGDLSNDPDGLARLAGCSLAIVASGRA